MKTALQPSPRSQRAEIFPELNVWQKRLNAVPVKALFEHAVTIGLIRLVTDGDPVPGFVPIEDRRYLPPGR